MTTETDLSLPENATCDDMAALLTKVKFILEQAKATYSTAEAAIFDHMKATGIKEFQIGQTTYFIGKDKKTVVRKELVGELLQLCIDLAGSPDEAVKMFLSSQPFKHGAFKKEAGEDAFKRFFEVIESEVLDEKEEKKKLKQFNPAFA